MNEPTSQKIEEKIENVEKAQKEQMSLQTRVALDTLERYSGSPAEAFCSNLIITNFPKYVDYFSKM